MRNFNAIERCDRCGAQARHAASKPGHHELLFCNHHYNKHREGLIDGYWLINSDEYPAEPVAAVAYKE